MALVHTPDCGEERAYEFYRPIRNGMFEFEVKTDGDAAICLAAGGEMRFQIFLGCWGGDTSGIRRGEDEDVIKVETPGILTEHHFKRFWIQVGEKKIKVGKAGKRKAFMKHKERGGLADINSYSFSTGWGHEGDWIFHDNIDYDSSSSEDEEDDDEACGLRRKKNLQYSVPAEWEHKSVVHHHGRCISHEVDEDVVEEGDVDTPGEDRRPCGIGWWLGHYLTDDFPRLGVGLIRHEGDSLVGTVNLNEQVCSVSLFDEVFETSKYYVLTSPLSGGELEWVPSCIFQSVPTGALEGGKTADGESFYIGRVTRGRHVGYGRVIPGTWSCHVVLNGEHQAHDSEYSVLCAKMLPLQW